jgi:5-methyltetrahydropteroyltriglutamate--homocysteine methyltransferase
MGRAPRPPYRADHVGSLLRPPELLQAREEHAAGRIDDAELRAVEDAAIRDVVRMQEDVGLQPATDGEFRRASWHMDFIYALGGISKAHGHLTVQFRNAEGDDRVHARRAARGRQRSALGDDLRRRLRVPAARSRERQTPEAHHPVAEHGPLSRRAGRDRRDVLPDLDAFWADLTAAYGRGAAPLGELGCTLPAVRRHEPRLPQRPRAARARAPIGGDAEHQHEAYIRHINEALAGRPAGMAGHTHMCRGNFRSSWVAEGGYDFVAEALFNELEVDGFFMEWDDERSGGFEPLRFVPKGKVVVLGLVTTKRGELETATRSAADRGGVALRRPRPALPLARSAASPRPSRATLTRASSRPQAAADRRDGRRRSGARSVRRPARVA